MKIGHGFTERVPTPNTPAPGTGKVANTRSPETTQAATGTGDTLQLSGFAARLNGGLNADLSDRADNVARISQAIATGTFVIDTPAVSRAIIAEGLQTPR